MKSKLLIALFVISFSTINSQQNWTHYIRTAGHGLNKSNIEATIKDAMETHLFGIEVDNDPPGRYESFLDPKEKLDAIQQMAKRAHEINNFSFVYIAGLECITANADKTEHSFFKDHPDWVQRNLDNKPAMFGGGDAFWIDEGDEDVWITPYAKEWRSIYMEHVRKIAKTGIDGIFVDIPYWMTHFDGWENSWASFDDYTVKAFKDKTGLDARKDLALGDFSDSNFRKWIDFRIETLTAFMAEVDENIKKENPNGKSFAEIYPGIGEEAVRVGADTYEMYNVVDVIAHEFSGGGGNAASKNPIDWFSRMIGMYTFRAFADGKASLMLSYSWGDENKIAPQDPIKNLMLSNVMAGTNCWDARGHVMSGSNDIETRKMVFKWIAENENIFYKPRSPINPIGVYFSPKTRNYFADEFIKSYNGIMNLMLQTHEEFQILTPRTLDKFEGDVLIFPDVKCISTEEVNYLKSFLEKGKGLIVTGETGNYDITGATVKDNPITELLNVASPNQKQTSVGKQKFIYSPQCPGKLYSDLCNYEFNNAAWEGTDENSSINKFRDNFIAHLNKQFGNQSQIIIKASPFLSTQTAMVENNPHIFIANYKGLKSEEIAKQIPEKDVTIQFTNINRGKVFYLPYLGEKIELEGKITDGSLSCVIPIVEKGGVVWVEK
ncbi:MAG: hypothetical protein WAR79_07380 [Melioribacteraceae bacterium]